MAIFENFKYAHRYNEETYLKRVNLADELRELGITGSGSDIDMSIFPETWKMGSNTAPSVADVRNHLLSFDTSIGSLQSQFDEHDTKYLEVKGIADSNKGKLDNKIDKLRGEATEYIKIVNGSSNVRIGKESDKATYTASNNSSHIWYSENTIPLMSVSKGNVDSEYKGILSVGEIKGQIGYECIKNIDAMISNFQTRESFRKSIQDTIISLGISAGGEIKQFEHTSEYVENNSFKELVIGNIVGRQVKINVINKVITVDDKSFDLTKEYMEQENFDIAPLYTSIYN